ncbi:LCP family protein [Alicyclobacillus mali]|uniref:LCP family protein n=1 Tax=Alicyclobacillus mali (ex Roth et al. 2021) TaxID=1123961 RepID=A0ABS0F664_9BACL|nr:LCP family protein [Alicyclobacillus mali (ex Roth et al. 2021)]MBF8378799.1 LCP family protein [Alicyclobacillus mali (ex Roth et al. 2021)]MCL6487794.1 LCP family protein [Alicyclobacillus mali (ex Roth et al. 2021)]
MKRHGRRLAWTALAAAAMGTGLVWHRAEKPPVHAHGSNPAITPSSWTATDPGTTRLKGRETILVLGSDKRPQDPRGNADVLLVASLDDSHRRVELLSIPRDTQVAFPDGRYHKINEALASGGPEETCMLVEHLIGLPIDHYAIIRFDALVNMVDSIGGLDIDVPRNMDYRTGDKVYGVIHLRKGRHHLNGEQALQFVRYRHDALGDIGRTERQQAFLMALKDQLLRPQTLPRLPEVAIDAWKMIDTDMSLGDLSRLAAHAPQYQAYRTVHTTLPGSFHDPDPSIPGDLSYWVVNPVEARYVAKRFFADGEAPPRVIQDPRETRTWLPPDDLDAKDASKRPTAPR